MITKEERLEKLERVKVIEKNVGVILGENSRIFNNITVLKSYVDDYGTMTITLCGGLNGNGEWENYFSDLSNITKLVKDKKYDFWLIDLHNDCVDDIFYATFGVKEKNE